MTQHLHNTHVPGCYRCELREDEARDHQTAEWDDQITDPLKGDDG